MFPIIRSCEEESKARMGVVECLNHKLVEPFTVLYEKEGEGNYCSTKGCVQYVCVHVHVCMRV